MKKLRLAIIGVNGIGRVHARAALATGAVEITACVARTRASAASFADEFKVGFATTSKLAVANRPDVDAAVICTPNKHHAPYALALLRAGKDVLIEKPMAMNASEAAGVAQSARRFGRVCMVGHMWRFDHEVRYLREVVASGAIGEVVKTKGYGIHVGWGPSGWFVNKRLAGGGALADMGVHAIDTTRFVLGDPAPARVYATLGSHYGDYEVDDTGIIMITWKTGATSIIESGWRQPHADRAYAGTQVFGTAGYASTFPTEAKFKVGGMPGVFKPDLPERLTHRDHTVFERQIEHFIECVRTRQMPSPGAAAGLAVMKIVDAAYESSRTGKAVKV